MSRIKTLDKDNLAKLQALEKELGCCVVAFEPRPEIATISQAQLNQLQNLEKQANAVLVAYKC